MCPALFAALTFFHCLQDNSWKPTPSISSSRPPSLGGLRVPVGCHTHYSCFHVAMSHIHEEHILELMSADTLLLKDFTRVLLLVAPGSPHSSPTSYGSSTSNLRAWGVLDKPRYLAPEKGSCFHNAPLAITSLPRW